MKVVLSRKGFDSSWGGGPSPIVDGKWLVSLPTEFGGKERKRQFNDVRWCGVNLGELLEQLYPRTRHRTDYCHLDPDIRRDALSRRARGWRPLFGQADGPAGHLRNLAVGPGDLFLFFGFFRESDGWRRFVRGAPPLHVIHGWLQIDQVITDPVAWVQNPKHRWAQSHPHTYGSWWKTNNTLFLVKRRLEIGTPCGQCVTALPGAGVFRRFNARLQLTAPNQSKRSVWQLPLFVRPDPKRGRRISHLENAHWTTERNGQHVIMDPKRATLWQEAVIRGNPDAARWAVSIVTELGTNAGPDTT